MDIAATIESLVPAAEYEGSLTGGTQEEFDALIWTDARQKPTWAALIAADVSLLLYKNRKKEAIDRKTDMLIEAGFTFDSQEFSLTLEAQKNWLGIKVLKAEMSALAMFPLEITTKNDTAYSLAEVDVDNFALAGVGAVNGHLTSGRALKVQVDAAVDTAGVDAVVDNR